MLLQTLLPLLAGPALGSAAALANTSPNDQVGADGVPVFPLADEPDFAPGFLIPSHIPLEEYSNFTHLMVPVDSIIDDGWDLELPDGSLFDGDLEASDEDGNSLTGRQNRQTSVVVGRTLVDYGCDASIRRPLVEAIHSLCSTGICDGGTAYTRTVRHLDRSPIRNAQLSITIEGNYNGRHTRGHIANVVENLVTPKSTQSTYREYFQQIGSVTRHHGCTMSKFGNYVAIYKNWGETVNIRMHIRLLETNQFCIGQNIFKEALGLVNPYALAFFNTFIHNCN